MLVSNPIQPNDIVSLKISNGDELIGKFIETSDNAVVLTKPMLMVLGQNPNGQPSVQMMPFFMLGSDKDAKYPINKDHIVCMVKSNEDAKGGYLQSTTGLTFPKSGSASSLITE